MINGIDTPIIPPTIKDWLAGKIVRALPQRLIQKLLGFLIDNRDMTETLAFREKCNGDVPEFTLLMYRTAKAKVRHEKSATIPNDDSKINDKPLFEAERLGTDGIRFFSEEMIVEQNQFIPNLKQVEDLRAKVKQLEDSVTPFSAVDLSLWDQDGYDGWFKLQF